MTSPVPILFLPAPDGGRFVAESLPDGENIVIRRESQSGATRWQAALLAGAGTMVALSFADDRVYAAIYSPVITGSRVLALDAGSGRIHWERQPEGVGGVLHSKYRNNVELLALPGSIVVMGRESAGAYTETLDPATGQTVSRTMEES